MASDSIARGLLVCSALLLPLASCDTVTVHNAAGDVGLLVDGEASGVAFNDRGRVGSGSGSVAFGFGALSSANAPHRNEAIAFGENRAPARSPTAWTAWIDGFDVTLGSPISIPVSVWIVRGPYDDQYDRAVEAFIQALVIWEAERAGLGISLVTIHDATSDPDIDGAILDSVGEDFRNWDDYSSKIGFDQDRINIYWINTVEGHTTWGWSDFHGRIVMGRETSNHLLAHELGHAFSLFHPAGCGDFSADFGKTNVMWGCSNTREFMAEGQIFRAHFNIASEINRRYHARPGQPQVDCEGHAQSEECLGIERRLWSDGVFGAQIP